MVYSDPTGKCVPGLEASCQWFWIPGTTYTGWDDFREYSADIVEGMGYLGAVAVDTVKGTHGAERIRHEAGIGTVLGGAIPSVLGAQAVVSMGGVVGVDAAVIHTGMLAGGVLDLSAQTVANRGDWTKFSPIQTYISLLSGGIGAGLGGAISGLTPSMAARIGLNGLGSAGVGGGLTALQNLLAGSCNDPLVGAAWAGAFGLAGSAIGEGMGNWANARPLVNRLRLDPRLLEDPSYRRAYLYTQEIARATGSLEHRTSLLVGIANALGIIIPNSTSFAPSIPPMQPRDDR